MQQLSFFIIHKWDKLKVLHIWLAPLPPFSSLLFYPCLFLFTPLLKKDSVAVGHNNCWEKRGGPMIVVSEGVIPLFFGARGDSASGPSGKTTLPFGVAQLRKQCFWSTIVVDIFCYCSESPGLAPEGGCNGVGDDEKLPVGGRWQLDTFSTIGQTQFIS